MHRLFDLLEEFFAMVQVDKSGDRVQRMFGEIAPRYDLMNHLLSMNTDRYWRWWTVKKLASKIDGPVLDVCTGTGDLAISFAKKLSRRHDVVGSDFCREMLEFGDQKKDRLSLEGVRFLQADTQCLPFPDESFSLVTVAFGLRNVADTDRGLIEMARVCKPGGRVAVLEFTLPRFAPLRWGYNWYFRNVLPRIGQLLCRNHSQAYDYLPTSVGEFPMYEALAERMREAGLRTVNFYPLTFGVATLYVGQK